MNMDQAVGKLYVVMKDCRHTSGYQEALQAIGLLEEATEALSNSQKVLTMALQENYDKELYGALLVKVIAENKRILGH